MKTVLSELVKDAAGRAVVDVFQTYDVRLQARPNQVPMVKLLGQASVSPMLVAARIGFTGDGLRGVTLLGTTFDLAALARPARLRKTALSSNLAADWIFVRDWVGELCNQVIGRIKNRVHHYGIAFDSTPPIAFSGSALVCVLPKAPVVHPFTFSVGNHAVWFDLDVIYEDASKSVGASSAEMAAAEGTVVIFD